MSPNHDMLKKLLQLDQVTIKDRICSCQRIIFTVLFAKEEEIFVFEIVTILDLVFNLIGNVVDQLGGVIGFTIDQLRYVLQVSFKIEQSVIRTGYCFFDQRFAK